MRGEPGSPTASVDDVVGVHGDGAVDVARALGLEVLLDDGDHLVLVHSVALPLVTTTWCDSAIIMR